MSEKDDAVFEPNRCKLRDIPHNTKDTPGYFQA